MPKIVLITGGNSGIGYATAAVFKEKGYQVFISGRNSVKVTLAANNLGVEPLIADMSDLAAVKNMADLFQARGLDVLVNNAAIAGFMPIDQLDRQLFTEFFDTNVLGPMVLIKELLPALEKRQGSIVNISSIITSKGLANASLYAATKGALEGFTRSLALELAPRNIRLNAVAPGAIDTPIMSKTGFSAAERSRLRARQEANIPLHRYGQPAEVARVVAAQAEATYVTGAVWAVDGGVDA